MRVIVTDALSNKGIERLRQELEVDVELELDEDELCEKIKGYDALVVRSGTQVTEKVINAADKLKVIGRAGVGVDNIDLAAATRKGILVINAPEGNTIAAAEHTVAMILSLSRNIPEANYSLKKGKWERKKFMGVEVKGKVLGIIGLGRIGYEVAKRAKGMEMKVIGFDPYITNEEAQKRGIDIVDFKTLITTSDYITIHAPLTDKTRHLLGEEEFALMKEGVRIINCARGGIVDEEALFNAMQESKVAGAAIDVFEEEPPVGNKLLELDNVIVTPHLGASTAEAQVNVAVDVAESIIQLLNNGSVKNAVNMSPISMEEWNYLRPFMNLAEKLGKFYAQFKNGRIYKVEMNYQGEITEHQTSLIMSSALKGILNTILQEPVNIINASQVARERGIKVSESYSREIEDYSNLITLRVYSDKNTGEVRGTIFSKKNARIVNIDDFNIDLIPDGYILLAYHKDQPGIIGKVSSLLGKNDVNIAAMQVGRKNIGGEALMALTVDEFVPETVLKEITEIQGIKDIKFVTF
ncbi:MAG: D-3-phosphoglycerate dehydrogenase / 2-oxoglutarate reductase [Clostridia bacterium]|nr:D-3-phosphoglycerate dehydrogenase / 2-oxoglutarate reductase [Clostridia bacterium]